MYKKKLSSGFNIAENVSAKMVKVIWTDSAIQDLNYIGERHLFCVTDTPAESG
jgi:hypothetical protein